MRFLYSTVVVLFVFHGGLTARELSAPGIPPVAFGALLHQTNARNMKPLDDLFGYILTLGTPQESLAYIDSLHRFAVVHKDSTLELKADFLRVYYYCHNSTYTTSDCVEGFQALLDKAGRYGITYMQIRAAYWLGHISWEIMHNYEQAFDYYNLMYKLSQQISDADNPDKADMLITYGKAYLSFRDYKRAIRIFHSAAAITRNEFSDNQVVSANNSLGVCYRNLGQRDSSDYFFRKVLECTDTRRYREWEGIANVNLGYNRVLAGEPDKAIPMLRFGLDRAGEVGDYSIVASAAIRLGNIYVDKENLREAKRMIDVARRAIGSDPQSSYLRLLYPVMCKYYALSGNGKLSAAYADSASSARDAYEKIFDSMILLRSEQKEAMQRQQEKEKELEEERVQHTRTRELVLIIGAGFVAVCCLLVVVAVLYRKKREAHRALVARVQQWAQSIYSQVPLSLPPALITEAEYEIVPTELPEDEPHSTSDSTDWVLFDRLHQLMDTEQLYRDADISIEKIAQRMNVGRTYLSRAVNRCTGRNFNTYLNEYRIREAILIMSRKGAERLTIDSIASGSGFNDRKGFHRVFKKVTGLSPTEFRKSLQRE